MSKLIKILKLKKLNKIIKQTYFNPFIRKKNSMLNKTEYLINNKA